jgi:hypothetical protein
MIRNQIRKDTEGPDGNFLRLGETREIAIYLRGGLAWVADFRDGRGELFTPGVWFALNRGAGLRAALESLHPLPASVIERIERLHAAERPLLDDLMARLRDGLAKVSRGLSRRTPTGALCPRP